MDELVVKVPRTGDRIDAPQNAKECREAQPHAPIPNRVYASDQILEGRDASGLKLPEADRANGKTTNLPEASSELDIEVRELIECSPLSKYLKKQLKGGLSALAIQGKSNRLNKELNVRKPAHLFPIISKCHHSRSLFNLNLQHVGVFEFFGSFLASLKPPIV